MAMKARYTVANGEIIAEKRGGVRRSYVPDPLGSTIALLDNTQTKTDTFSYWPYGEVQSRTGTTATPFQFVGTLGYYRDATDRMYVRARYLRPNMSRWQTIGPIWLHLSNFTYVGGSPSTFRDRSGLAVEGGRVIDPIRQNEYLERMKGIKGGFYLAIAACLYDFAAGVVEEGATAEGYFRACKTCCQGLAAWAGAAGGSYLGPWGTVIGGLGGYILGGIGCDDLCCQFFPDVRDCMSEFDEGPPPRVLPPWYEACCCDCGGVPQRCPCDELPYGCHYINPRPPCGPCYKELV